MQKKKPISISYLNKKFEGFDPEPIGEHNYSAVLLPLIEKEDGLHLLFQVRADTLKTQPGEIGYPGGKMEPGEIPVECAIRETMEELCIPAKEINIISELNYISANSFTMYCFLGEVDENVVDLNVFNRDEVKELFTVPLEFFLKTKPYVYKYEIKPDIKEDFPYEDYGIDDSYNWRKSISTVPLYTYDDKVIWGLTARLTQDLVRLIKE